MLPKFYNPTNAERWEYHFDSKLLNTEVKEWMSRVAPAEEDKRTVGLVIVDVQKDFCFPQGGLFVAGRSGRGAVEDSDRIAQFIYRNLPHISNITLTLDSHYPLQIFFDSFWQSSDGTHPPPFTQITSEQIANGGFTLDPIVFSLQSHQAGDHRTWAENQVQYYLRELEKQGKYSLIVWPYHAMVGSSGHSVVGVVEEAVTFHSKVRQTLPQIEMKGENPWSEHYSVFGAEVLGQWNTSVPLLQKNDSLIRRLAENDVIVFVGQASSHCLKASVDDFLSELSRINPKKKEKVYVVEDCTSAVCLFDDHGKVIYDFSSEAEKAFDDWKSQGVRLVSSTIPLLEWEGLSDGLS